MCRLWPYRLALAVSWLYGRRVRRRSTARRRLLPRVFLGLLLSRPAVAQPSEVAEPEAAGEAPFRLAIEKAEAASGCPELPWFRARIAAHAGKQGQAGDFAVSLSRRGGVWSAKIARRAVRQRSPAAQRALQDRSPSCEPLAEAVAITIAILADEISETKPTEPAAPAPRAPPKSVPPPRASGEEPSHAPPRVWVGAGGGASLSWISPIAPVLGFGISAGTTFTRHGVRLMLTTEQKFELVPGRVVVQAWLGTAFSCAQLPGRRFGAALCATFDASMLRASAEGFDDGRPSSRAYEALGLEAQPSWHITGRYRLSLVLAALVPFSRESFSVEGRGVAYVPPALNYRFLIFSEIGTF